MIIVISGRNADFYRRISRKSYASIVRSVPSKGMTIADLERLRGLLWSSSKPASVSDTYDVDASIVDNCDDPETSQESWLEALEELEA